MSEREVMSREDMDRDKLEMQLGLLKDDLAVKMEYIAEHPEDPGAQAELEILETDIVDIEVKLKRLEDKP